MFLSDELIEMGRKANPKNNLSMCETMIAMCNHAESKINVLHGKQIANAMKFAIRQLVKEGYVKYGELMLSVENEIKKGVKL